MRSILLDNEHSGVTACPSCTNDMRIRYFTDEIWGTPDIVEAYAKCDCGFDYEFYYGNGSLNGQPFYNQPMLNFNIRKESSV